MLKRASHNKAADDDDTGGVALPYPELPRQLVSRVGYVEDVVKPRTQLMARFSIRLKEPLAAEKERPRHPRMRHPQTDAVSCVVKILLIQQVDDVEPQHELLGVP